LSSTSKTKKQRQQSFAAILVLLTSTSAKQVSFNLHVVVLLLVRRILNIQWMNRFKCCETTNGGVPSAAD
jgi:hypothetical protein